MDDTPFIDAHMHLWDLKRVDYPWLSGPFDDDGPNGSVEAIARDYGMAEFRSDLAGWNLAGCVHIEAGANPAHALAETAWLEGVAKQSDLPIALVGHADLTDPAIEEHLAAQARSPLMRGIRHIANWHPDPARSYTPKDYTSDPVWQANFAHLADHGLSFDLQCYPSQMAGLADLFAQHPGIAVAINHLGMPVLSDQHGLRQWSTGLALLAQLPQVSIKISGLGFITRDWDLELVKPLIEHVVGMFGPDRCMLASDVPTDKLFAPVERYREAYSAILSQLGGSERRAVAAETANRFYRLDLTL